MTFNELQASQGIAPAPWRRLSTPDNILLDRHLIQGSLEARFFFSRCDSWVDGGSFPRCLPLSLLLDSQQLLRESNQAQDRVD